MAILHSETFLPVSTSTRTGRERYRVRRVAYRIVIVYEIEDDVLVIVVVKVGHRGEACRGRWEGIEPPNSPWPGSSPGEESRGRGLEIGLDREDGHRRLHPSG